MVSLESVLTSRLSEDAASWFREALKKVRSKGEATDAVLILWSGAGRRLGQLRIESPTADEVSDVYRIDTDTDAATLAARCADLARKLISDAAAPQPGKGASASPAVV